ncbi:endosome-associated-trafficking regulator 1-like [Liolophura sinensis]|uniref:endosome-associated-trafficking regulator 1-like n=1 Tax=Liolophura sinensis TaxID=3198878 RepID=UPI003158C03A
MAEGGSSDQEDNPFSFQKFVKKKKKDTDGDSLEEDGEEVDVFDLPDISTPARKNVPDLSLEDEVDLQLRKKGTKKNNDENPFSFKKFLKGSGGGSHSKGYSQRSRNGLAAPDFASDLPDFVQDHYSSENGQERLSFRDPLELPDFALDTSVETQTRQNSSHSPGRGADSFEVNGNRTRDFGSVDVHVNAANGQPPDINVCNRVSHESVSDEESSDVDEGPQLASSLPDFLSDGAIGNTDGGSNPTRTGYSGITVQVSSGRNVAAFEVNGDLELELRRVREDNHRLRDQLSQQANRLREAEQRIETIQKREADDTAALEKMVHQVEANLVTTTQRAVQAETTVTRLKQEVKSLQGQLKTTKGDNPAQSADQTLTSIQERTKYASEQLSAAAKTAEQSLKQLLTGVDSMKLLAEVLATIDKVTEEAPSGGAEGGQS